MNITSTAKDDKPANSYAHEVRKSNLKAILRVIAECRPDSDDASYNASLDALAAFATHKTRPLPTRDERDAASLVLTAWERPEAKAARAELAWEDAQAAK